MSEVNVRRIRPVRFGGSGIEGGGGGGGDDVVFTTGSVTGVLLSIAATGGGATDLTCSGAGGMRGTSFGKMTLLCGAVAGELGVAERIGGAGMSSEALSLWDPGSIVASGRLLSAKHFFDQSCTSVFE